MIKIPKLKILFLLSTFYFLVSGPAFAADIFFGAKTNEARIGEQFEVRLFVNTPEESVNAFEGKITFPSDFVRVKEIRDGNSIINFWIDKPKAENGIIIFSGITPGGFQGKNGFIFSAIFEARKEGQGIIEIRDARILKNDGVGTPAEVKISNFQFLISNQFPISQIPKPEVKDTEQPESFAPEIAKDKTLFDGKWFVVFVTQDKGSGIDHYEILEKEQKSSIRSLIKKDKWQVAESPYLLKDQKLKSRIFVKAIDKAGNERIAVVEPRYPMKWYENYLIWGIIIVIISIGCMLWKIFKSKIKYQKLK